MEETHVRVALRNQLHHGGIDQIFEKMTAFNNELLNRKIDEFWELEENDNESIYGGLEINDAIDPKDMLDRILASLTGTRAYEFFHSILQHLLMIQCDNDKRYDGVNMGLVGELVESWLLPFFYT